MRELIERDSEAEEQAIALKLPESELRKLSRRHRILKKAIRVSSPLVNRSSMLLLRPKKANGFFNSKNLTREIKRIIAPRNDWKLNKVVIPRDPKDNEKELDYGRAFFDLTQISLIDDIKDALEKDATFSENVEVHSFEVKDKVSNMLYVKGFAKRGEEINEKDMEIDLRNFFKELNPAWNIISVYFKKSEQGAWAYLTFASSEECHQAHNVLKPLSKKFRGKTIFANVKNQQDDRAVIVYNVKSTVTIQ